MRVMLFLFSFLMPYHIFSQKVAIEIPYQNTIYLGKDNYIYVVVENYACSDLSLEAKNCIIKKENDCQFTIRPKFLDRLKVDVFLSIGNEKLKLREILFKVRQEPILQPTLAFRNSTNFLTKSELIQRVNLGIFYSIDPAYVCGNVKADKFKYTFFRHGAIISSGNYKDNDLDSDLMVKIENLKPFDEVLFYDIEVMLSGQTFPFISDPIKMLIIDDKNFQFNSSLFYPEIKQQYWDYQTNQKQVRYWENYLVSIEYENLKSGMKRRIEYDTLGNLIREAVVKQKLEVDTIYYIHPDSYEHVTEVKKGYIDVFDGEYTDYKIFNGEKIVRLQGQYKENLKTGIWKACKETAPDKYECYEAEFKDDVMVGEIRKI